MQHIIERFINLGKKTPSNFYPVICNICHDHGKKGKRGGFRFDADTTIYHCFNCGYSASYDGVHLTKKFIQLLEQFNIPAVEINKLKLKHINDKQSHKIIVEKDVNIIDLPNSFVRLTEPTDIFAEIAIEFLHTRGLTVEDNTFYYVPDNTGLYAYRVIIPIYYNNNLYGYQARSVLPNKPPKYVSTNLQGLLFNRDVIFDHSQDNIYIVEGMFDAIHINGVAVLKNTISKSNIALLNNSKKPKIVIPDYDRAGTKLVNIALEQGWNVSFPEWSAKDISEAVVKYGKLYTIKTIHDHITDGLLAQVKTKLKCR